MSRSAMVSGACDQRQRGTTAPTCVAHAGTVATVAREGLSLTARGRRVVVAAAIGLAVLVGFIGGRADAAAVTPEPVATVTVEPGDTLWAIAGEVRRGREDIRDVIAEIQRLNGLAGAQVLAGDVLVVPTR